MKGKQPEYDAFESPFAATILPAKGKAARADKRERGRSKKPQEASAPDAGLPVGGLLDALPVAAPAPQAVPAGAPAAPIPAQPGPAFAGVPTFGPMGGQPAFPPAPGMPQAFAPTGFQGQPAPGAAPAPGYPQAPGYSQAPGYPQTPGYPQAPGYPQTPGYPQGGYPPAEPSVDLNPAAQPFDTDQRDDAAAPHDDDSAPAKPAGSKRRTAVLLAALLVVVLAAAGYYAVPKYVLENSASTPTSVVFPATIDGLAKQSDPKTQAAEQSALKSLRAAGPAVANVQIAAYGKVPNIVVAAGLLPSTVAAKTPAEQIALVHRIGAAMSPKGTPIKLHGIPQTGKNPGQWWCGAAPAAASGQTSIDCVSVDQKAVVVVTATAAKAATAIALAQQVHQAVEQH